MGQPTRQQAEQQCESRATGERPGGQRVATRSERGDSLGGRPAPGPGAGSCERPLPLFFFLIVDCRSNLSSPLATRTSASSMSSIPIGSRGGGWLDVPRSRAPTTRGGDPRVVRVISQERCARAPKRRHSPCLGALSVQSSSDWISDSGSRKTAQRHE
jgi:hypothetical protein